MRKEDWEWYLQQVSRLDRITHLNGHELDELLGRWVRDREALSVSQRDLGPRSMGSQRVGRDLATEQQQPPITGGGTSL